MLDDKISSALRLKGALELPIPSGAGLEIHIAGGTVLVRIPIYVSSRLKEAQPEWTVCELDELPETIAKLYLQLGL